VRARRGAALFKSLLGQQAIGVPVIFLPAPALRKVAQHSRQPAIRCRESETFQPTGRVVCADGCGGGWYERRYAHLNRAGRYIAPGGMVMCRGPRIVG
jgi:hypothetical protein